MAYFNKFLTRNNISKILRCVKSDKKDFKCFKSSEDEGNVFCVFLTLCCHHYTRTKCSLCIVKCLMVFELNIIVVKTHSFTQRLKIIHFIWTHVYVVKYFSLNPPRDNPLQRISKEL